MVRCSPTVKQARVSKMYSDDDVLFLIFYTSSSSRSGVFTDENATLDILYDSTL